MPRQDDPRPPWSRSRASADRSGYARRTGPRRPASHKPRRSRHAPAGSSRARASGRDPICARQASSRLKVPTTLLITKACGPSIERSTCDSAARWMTASGRWRWKTPANAARSRQIDLFELIARIAGHRRQRRGAGGIAELVEIDDPAVGGVPQQPAYGRSDEAGAARHQNGAPAQRLSQVPLGQCRSPRIALQTAAFRDRLVHTDRWGAPSTPRGCKIPWNRNN